MEVWLKMVHHKNYLHRLSKKSEVPKVAICFRGRLGNQLFQSAAAMYLEDLGYSIQFDISTADHGSLDILEMPILREYVLERLMPSSKYLPAPFGRFAKFARVTRRILGYQHFIQNFDSWAQFPDDIDSRTVIDGYWQNLRYCQPLESRLRFAIGPNQNESNEEHQTLAVHIRRGEFIGEGNHLPINYYKDLIDKIKILHSITEVKIFSDDINYCKQYLSGDFNYRENQKEVEDFIEIAKCDFIILSRSTFSWWAAKISKATIYAPDPWFRLAHSQDDQIIPSNWLSIDV